jgi:hypothetical protein
VPTLDVAESLEPGALIQGDVPGIRGFQICQGSIAIALPKGTCHQRRATTFALMCGIHADHGQVPVGLTWVIRPICSRTVKSSPQVDVETVPIWSSYLEEVVVKIWISWFIRSFSPKVFRRTRYAKTRAEVAV